MKKFVRHPLNARHEAVSRRDLKNLIIEHGVARGVRGNPWAVPTSPDLSQAVFQLIAAATLTEA
eukprot:2102194-Pyramimonas_sp.AAC.1